jgi:hypothetical protein
MYTVAITMTAVRGGHDVSGAADLAATVQSSTLVDMEHDLGILAVTSLIPLLLVLATEVLKDRNRLSSIQSRKFLHICTGPLFALTWPWYSSSRAAR